MPRFLVLASFDQKLGEFTYEFDTRSDLLEEPDDTTLGFRQVFRKCITSVKYSSPKRIPVNWLGRKFQLEGLYYFESVDTPFGETEGDVFLVGLIMSIRQLGDTTLHRLRSSLGLDEQEAIYTLLGALPLEIRKTFTDQLVHTRSFPGLMTYVIPQQYEHQGHRAMLLFGFFYVGKLILWRIRRDQADVNISLQQRNFKEAIFLTAIQRSRIINIKRYQLTSNISNNADMQGLSNGIKERLNLEREYANDEELNTLFEEYLASLERLFTEQSRKRIERGVAVFSFIAVPFTVFAAFVAVIALPESVRVFDFALRQSLDAGIWFLLGLSTAIPMVIYAVTFMGDRNERISKRLANFRARYRPSKSARMPPPPGEAPRGIQSS